MAKEDSVSIRKGVGSTRNVRNLGHHENIWLYHVLVNGHTSRSFTSAEKAEAYVIKNYGHIPLVRRAY